MKFYQYAFYFLILLSILLIFLLFNKNNIDRKVQEIIKFDTILIYKPQPIILEKIIPKIKYIRDTIITTKPFVARVDTVIKYDSIKIDYHFPENNIDLSIYRNYDTIRVEKYLYNQIKSNENEWYINYIGFLVGFASGYIIFK
jgi:hypothetical protein